MEIIKTQKQLKRALFSKKESLSPKEIFLSDAYKEFLTQMTKGFVKDFSGSSLIYKGSSEEVAYTEGLDIHINFNSEMSKSLNVSEKNKFFKGLNLHELGHILLTDFRMLQQIAGKIFTDKVLYPKFEAEYKEELEEFAQAKPMVVFQIFQSIQNAIEDGYVDRVMMAKTPGYGPYLKFVREIDFEQFPTYKEQKAMDYPSQMIFHNLVLGYARFGVRGYDESDKDDLIDAFKKCEVIISNAVFDTLPRNRFIAAWKVLVILFHFIKEEMEKKEDEKDGEGESEGSGSGSSEKEEKGEGESKEKSEEKSKSSDEEKSEKSSESGDGEAKEDKKSSPSLEKAMEDLADKTPKESTERKGTPTAPSKEAMRVAEELLEKEKSESDEKEESKEKSTKESEESSSSTEEKEIEKLKETVAKEKISEEQEKAIYEALSKDKEKDSVGIHARVRSEIKRAKKDARGERLYEEEHAALDTIVKRFIRDFLKEIEDRQIGSTQKGLYFGKNLTIDQVYRKDKKIFNNKIAPEEIPDMGVGILVDLSGSMYGEKMDRARECAYITYQFCQALEIPCFVIGHTVNYCTSKVEFHCVADENNLDKQDAKRIFSLEAGGDNRDGYALRYAYRKLETIPAETRLLLVISDGAPCDSTSDGVSYHMHNGAADMKRAVSEAIKKGLKTIVAGLGSDAPYIKACYKEGVSEQNSAQFLDVSDIEKMPKAFVKILKGYLE